MNNDEFPCKKEIQPFEIGEHVQFHFCNLDFQGSIIEIINDNPNRIVIEVNACNDYRALNNPFYNRVTILETDRSLSRNPPQNWS